MPELANGALVARLAFDEHELPVAIAAGNAVVLKPSEKVPLSAVRLEA